MSRRIQDEPTIKTAAYRGEPPPARVGLGGWALRALALVLVVGMAGAGGAIALFAMLSKGLPDLRSLADYHPKQAVLVRAPGKTPDAPKVVVARFAEERRTVVPYGDIPKVMIDAVLAAEDDQFFQHEGLDYVGIARCTVQSALAGRTICGGSTITQQTVKTFLLSNDRKIERKLKEFILSKRVEDAFTKQEILYLYLNQIYFGHGAYGVEEAARVYFGKSVKDLGLEEAALLAGLPQSPTRLDPYKYPERATKRRAYVLRRLHELGHVDDATYVKALASPLAVDWRGAEADLDNNSSYAAEVRRQLELLLGPEVVAQGGLVVDVGLDPKLQRASEDALRQGLRELDKRQGWRGARARLRADEDAFLRGRLATRLSTAAAAIAAIVDDAGRPLAYQPVVWDLSRADWSHAASERPNLERAAHEARIRRLVVGEIYGGVVVDVDAPKKRAIVQLAPEVLVELPFDKARWARKANTERMTPAPRAIGDVVALGDVVDVRVAAFDKPDADGRPSRVVAALEQEPRVQGALVAIDPTTRDVRALVGGYGVGAGAFNRATQAERQAGSTFKPFVYGAAIRSGRFTTASTCIDAPQTYRDPWTGKAWKPKNYDGRFDGEITLRTALTKSKNLCSVWLVERLGIAPVAELARAAGVTSEMPQSQTIALGSITVSPLEMVNAYATLAGKGRRASPVFVSQVVDERGQIVYAHTPDDVQAMDPTLAYQITSLMQSVVEDGTAKAVTALGRPIAGKTGTTNESRDAWFIGFSPELVIGVWVGFDDNGPLGPGETGGRSAIPIFMDAARVAFDGRPPLEFEPPEDVTFAWVEPASRTSASPRLAAPGTTGARLEPFLRGTEPWELATSAKTTESFGLDDFER
jgi:penicillin-binding protein 1A